MSEQVESLGLPPGFTLRPPKTVDLEACVALLQRCGEVKGGADRITVGELAGEWRAPGAELTRNFRVITDAIGQVVAYGEAWDIQAPPVDTWIWARVDPAYEGKGLGSALMTWAEEVAAAAADRCPPEARVVMRAGAIDDYPPARVLFEARGMGPVRRFYQMTLRFDGVQPPEPEWPGGITLRSYRHPDEFAEVVRADVEAFQDHWGFMERPFEQELALWHNQVESDPFFSPEAWFVAVADGDIAGVCLCTTGKTEAPELFVVRSLAVRRPWRRRGLGTALLQHAVHAAFLLEKEGVTLGVDTENLSGATAIYTRAGMVPTRVIHVYEKELRPGVSLVNLG